MANTLNDLNDADRADFEARLANFGVDTSVLIGQDLNTTASAITTLTNRQDSPSQYQPVLLRTTDFERVNQWIGVPDQVFQATAPLVDAPVRKRDGVLARIGRVQSKSTSHELNISRAIAAPGSERVPQLQEFVSKMTSEDFSEVRTAARAYLRGNSKALVDYKSVIEAVFPIVEIPLWPFFNVVVKSGSVLEFGPGPHALVAYSVTIEDGGIIRSYGDLTVSATVLQRSRPLVVTQFDPVILATRRFGKLAFET